MLIDTAIRYDQCEDEIDRMAIDSVEIDRFGQLQEYSDRFLAGCQPTVRYRNTVTQTGTAQFFTSNQTVEEFLGIDVGITLSDQVGDTLEGALFAAALYATEDVLE